MTSALRNLQWHSVIGGLWAFVWRWWGRSECRNRGCNVTDCVWIARVEVWAQIHHLCESFAVSAPAADPAAVLFDTWRPYCAVLMLWWRWLWLKQPPQFTHVSILHQFTHVSIDFPRFFHCRWLTTTRRSSATTPTLRACDRQSLPSPWAVIQMAAKKSGPKVPFVALEEAYYVIKGAIFDRTTSQARAMSDVSRRPCCCFHARETPFHMPFDCTPNTVPSASLFTRSICSPTTPHPRVAAPPSP